jgi:hypothetical protein
MEIEQIATAHEAVMGRGVVLGEVVGQIVGTLAPVDVEVALSDPVANPVEPHVHGFGSALFDSAIGNAGSARVVRLDWGGRLGVSHVLEGGPKPSGVLTIVEKCPKFGLGRRGDHNFQDRTGDMDISVDGGRCGLGIQRGCMVGRARAHEEITTGAATCLGFRQV